MLRCAGVRTGSWHPTATEWSACLQKLQALEPNEVERIERFRIKEDAKRSLVGRFLARRLLAGAIDVPVDRLSLHRSEKGRPLCRELTRGDFNISHHGDWVVGGIHTGLKVGIDVMRYDEPLRGRDSFFRTMTRQFTPSEWGVIGTDLKMFYKNWALKEAYLKAVGIGIGFDLQRVSFQDIDATGTGGFARAIIDAVATDRDWLFYVYPQSLLDEQHCVAVALGPLDEQDGAHVTYLQDVKLQLQEGRFRFEVASSSPGELDLL